MNTVIHVLETSTESSDFITNWRTNEEQAPPLGVTDSLLWNQLWQSCFEKNIEKKQFYSYTTHENQHPIILPFTLKNKKNWGITWQKLEFSTQSWGAEFLGPKSSVNPSFIHEIYEEITKNINLDLIQLQYLSAPIEVSNKIGKNYLFSCCPLINCQLFASADEYFSTQWNSRKRNRIKQYEKKLQRKNHFWVRHPLEEIDDNLACEILKVTESKKKDNKHNMYDNPEVMDFMKSIYKNMKGHFTGLRIDGELAIYAITIYGKSSHHLFTLSYNRTYQNLNLGTLLLNYEITQLPFEKLHYYSMGTGMDIYKLKFATQLQPLYQLVGAGSSIKGKLISKFSHHRAQKQEKAMLNEIERHCEIPLRSVFL